MVRSGVVIALLFSLIASFSYAVDAGNVETEIKWFCGINLDRAQVFRDDYSLSQYRIENELSMFTFGLWNWAKGKRESNLRRSPDPLPAEVSFSANVGVSKIYKFDNSGSFGGTSCYIPNSPFLGASVNGIQYVISDRIFWGGGANYYIGLTNNNDIIYTEEPAGVLFTPPTKVSGTWDLSDLFLSVGCNLIWNAKVMLGCEQRWYSSNFKYSEYRYLNPSHVYNERDQLVDRRWFGGITWANEKMEINLMRRIQNCETGVGGYFLGVKYYI